MEDKRSDVIALHRLGKTPSDILVALRGRQVNRKFIYRTNQRYTQTGSVEDRHRSGRPLSATTSENTRKVRDRLRRNPRRSARKMAGDLGISERSVRRVLKSRLHTHPYKIQRVQALTDKQKATRLQRAKALKARCATLGDCEIVSSDEKLFSLQQLINKQNDRLWCQGRSSIDSDLFLATRRQGEASVMVWAAISASGRTPLVFVPAGVKMNAAVYQNLILQHSLLPWATRKYRGVKWLFQQVSAPAHGTRTTKAWLEANVPDFLSPEEWPPYSPDLNPLDFAIWSILEAKVCASRHYSLDSLKASLQREWQRIPQEVLRTSTEAFRKRLDLVITARGGYIEQY